MSVLTDNKISVQNTKPLVTHSMDRRGDVNVDPDTRPIKAQMGTDEEASTGALGVLPVLPD